jgi:hypothetical protein
LAQQFAKKQKEAKTVAKEKEPKSNMEMTEAKYKISVRHNRDIADGHSHIYAVSERLTSYSRFNGKSDQSV